MVVTLGLEVVVSFDSAVRDVVAGRLISFAMALNEMKEKATARNRKIFVFFK